MKKLATILGLALLVASQTAWAQLGWVGNMYPSGTGNAPSGSGGSFTYTVYVQVYKAGVTEAAGQGAGITCDIWWSGGVVSPYPGGAWPAASAISMTYNVDIGNNDEYKANIVVTGNGGYEYTARCSDDGGATHTWQNGGNGGFNLTGLPVSLVEFSATTNENTATLGWTTASENNSDYFAVEHSANGGAWTQVSTVKAAGTSSEIHNYTLKVDGLEVGQHAFRLKKVDLNGNVVYSHLVKVTIEVPGQYILYPAYPNPFNPSTNIRFAVAEKQPVTVSLYNMLGQTVQTLFNGTVEANALQTLQVNASGLPSGTYLVRVTGNTFSTTQKVTLAK